MIFNSKQLEELENIQDSTGAFEEEGDEESGFDEVGEAAMDWRRGLIEEAAENVKRAKGRPVESHLTYPIGSMLFEREARRFARVQRSVPGYLKIVYLSGGDREFGTLDVTTYLRDYGAEKRLSELSEQLGMAAFDVAIQLERLGITPIEEPETPEGEAAAEPEIPAEIVPPPIAVRAKRAPVVEVEESDEGEAVEDDAVAEDVVVAAPAKGRGGDSKLPQASAGVVRGKAPPAPPPKADKAPPAKAAAPAAAPAGKAAAAKAARAEKAEKVPEPKGGKAAKGGKTINPIDDPNGYIKANYQEMSNRELARFTGLSEHTIRRKLGEWGLKRKTP